jgi:hypothetical protein
VKGLGQPGLAVAGQDRRIGQVFVVRSSGTEQYFVLWRDGLSPLTQTDALLLLGSPDIASAYPGGQVRLIELTPSDFGAAPRSTRSTETRQYPPVPPKAVPANGTTAPCLQIEVGRDAGASVRVGLGPAGAGAANTAAATGTSDATGATGGDDPATAQAAAASADTGLADRIEVQPGTGLLVRAQPAPGVSGGTLYLLADTGVKYPLPSQDVARTLGYGDATPVAVPTTLLSLMPTGAPLDPGAARTTLPVATSDQSGTAGAAGGAGAASAAGTP